MKCRYTSANGRLEFEVEGDSQKAIFAHVACLQEIFEADAACGCCGSDDIRFRVRQAENKAKVKCDYYELHCVACGARLSYGQHQTGGTLFVKRKDANGNPLANRGWYIYSDATTGAGPITPTPTRQATAPIDDSYARTIAGLDKATDAKNADEWLVWGAKSPRTVAQKAEQEKAHKTALERIARRSQA